ncbi:MAG TPA: NAD(P)H-dependent oxidoreductase [Candidatus Acidoferrales bacterium]|nr:NAD(P)H-dependent oxidoreductase [Candidatus Acidoferrales bacterium]
MDTLNDGILLDCLNRRYATKQFDPQRKIDPEDWATLEEALLLTPSSFGLQPWKFVVVTDAVIKKYLVAASSGQRQVADCSHLVVFTRKNLTERDVDVYLDRIAVVRGVSLVSLANLRSTIIAKLFNQFSAKHRNDWAAHQVYIALGNFLTSAALLEIDTCPLGGIDPDQYDRILGLRSQGLSTVVACAAGHGAATDAYASLRKVRFPKDKVFMEVSTHFPSPSENWRTDAMGQPRSAELRKVRT